MAFFTIEFDNFPVAGIHSIRYEVTEFDQDNGIATLVAIFTRDDSSTFGSLGIPVELPVDSIGRVPEDLKPIFDSAVIRYLAETRLNDARDERVQAAFQRIVNLNASGGVSNPSVVTSLINP